MSDSHLPPARRPRWSCALLALPLALPAAAFELVDSTVDGGGQHSQGSRFALQGTIAQSDTEQLAGSRFAIDGGFWPGVPGGPSADAIFSNSFEG